MMKTKNNYIVGLLLMALLTACSTTSGLQEDEVLYTGIKKIRVEDKQNTYAESVALTEVEAALAYAPNSSFMGSSSMRFPISIGLWIYNKYVNNRKNGFSRWMFDTFSTTPITMTMVNPETRVKVATNTLQNYGYFQGNVTYDILPQKNPKKAKISYNIKLGEPYLIDSIEYIFPAQQDSIVRATANESYLKQEGQFSVVDLQLEKERLTNEFRNQGYYFYRPDYIRYIADSMMVPQKVQLLVAQDYDTPERAQHKWYIGNISTYIRTRQKGEEGRPMAFSDSTDLRGLKIVWTGDKNPISPRVIFRNFRFWRRQEFSQSKMEETLANLSNMQIFSRLQFTCTPRDTTSTCDTLDVRLDVSMDQSIEAEFDFNITQKSNSQIGPNATILLSKRNAFGHGETFSLKLKGSYEWLTKGAQMMSEQDQINSYEAGAGVAITYPWLAFPGLSKKRFRYPTSTSFKFDFDHLNRSGYYRLLSFNAEATYAFQTSKSFIHRVTPLSLTYDRLEHTTEKFDSIAMQNRALLVSLEDQFIPAMQYVLTYNNNWDTHRRFNTWMELSFKESSNIIAGVSTLMGWRKFNDKDRKMFSTPYSQFLKLSLDLRNKYKLTDKSLLATRLYAGAMWSYGNSTFAPYSEMFYVGGANDIRAFAARAIGPGSYHDPKGHSTYLDQSGDLKLEANIEYRFHLVSNLHGALFLDAGNVWLLSEDYWHVGGKLWDGGFFKKIALGTGFGFRYDLEFLVLRFDLGIGIHAPYDTGKSSYYNMPKFWDSLGFHFAVGYPF
jgi:outer membrane protein assembly factor BamA